MLDIMAGNGPEGQFSARFLVEFPQVQLLDVVVVPVMCNNTCSSPAAHSGGAAGAAHHRGSSTSPSWRRGWFPWSTLFHRPWDSTVAVPRQGLTCPLLSHTRGLGWSRQCSFCGVPQLALFSGVSFFLAVYTGYTARGSPAIRRRRGGGGRRELAPRCSATQLGCIVARARTDSPCCESFVPHTPQHTSHTHNHRNTHAHHTTHISFAIKSAISDLLFLN